MHTYKITKLPKQTIEITLTIPWEDIINNYGKAFDVIHADFSFEGFRKGKVPKTIAEKHIKKDTVYNQLIRTMLPPIYDEIIQKEKLQPVIAPRIDLSQVKENEQWVIIFKTAERPTVELGKYKEAVKTAKTELKKDDIWVPGKEPTVDEKADEEKKQKSIQLALDAVLKEVNCEISELIIEEELNNRLTQVVDDIQKIGLTVDAYLKSKNLTMEDMRARYQKEIEEAYKMEFILQAIADAEGIKVDRSELDKLFTNIKDDKERQSVQQNAYFYATILRKQKTLDYINSL